MPDDDDDDDELNDDDSHEDDDDDAEINDDHCHNHDDIYCSPCFDHYMPAYIHHPQYHHQQNHVDQNNQQLHQCLNPILQQLKVGFFSISSNPGCESAGRHYNTILFNIRYLQFIILQDLPADSAARVEQERKQFVSQVSIFFWDIGYWTLDIGHWILDIGYWSLNIGH